MRGNTQDNRTKMFRTKGEIMNNRKDTKHMKYTESLRTKLPCLYSSFPTEVKRLKQGTEGKGEALVGYDAVRRPAVGVAIRM